MSGRGFHLGPEAKAAISAKVRASLADPEVQRKRAAVSERRVAAGEQVKRQVDALFRYCVVCGERLIRRPKEGPSDYMIRITCGWSCANSKEGRAVAKNRIGSSLDYRPPRVEGRWPEGVSFAEHESAEAEADRGSRFMPSLCDFLSLVGNSGMACVGHRWAGLD